MDEATKGKLEHMLEHYPDGNAVGSLIREVLAGKVTKTGRKTLAALDPKSTAARILRPLVA